MDYDLEGNLYAWQDNTLIKFSADHKEIARYFSGSPIEGFSIATKWKIYIFHDDKIQLLSSKLTPLGEEIHLPGQVLTVDGDGFIWYKDNFSSSVSKYDPLTKTNIFSFDLAVEPDQFLSAGGNIYITGNDQLLIYNNFGKLLEQVPATDATLEIFNDQVFLLQRDILKSLDNTTDIKIPEAVGSSAIGLGKDKIALSLNHYIFIYRPN